MVLTLYHSYEQVGKVKMQGGGGGFYFYKCDGSMALQWSAVSPHGKNLWLLFVTHAFQCACVDFLQALQFPPTVKKKHAHSGWLETADWYLGWSSWWWTAVPPRAEWTCLQPCLQPNRITAQTCFVTAINVNKSSAEFYALHLLWHQAADLANRSNYMHFSLSSSPVL